MLHVTNGDMAAVVLRGRGLTGTVLPWRDVLHEGPVTALDHRDLARERAGFLAASGWGRVDELLEAFVARDEALLAAVAEGEPITLWFEDDLYDQLQLVQVLSMAGEHAALTMAELPRPPRELGPDPEAEPLGAEHVALARAVWQALRAGDVEALHALSGDRDAVLPHLPPALERLLEELPATTDGLTRTERTALRAIEAGAHDREAVFAAVAEAEERPFLGDAWLFARLDTLAPLLEAEETRISPLGEAVLAEREDWLRIGRIDRYLGGVRVRSPGPAWRWDPALRAPRMA